MQEKSESMSPKKILVIEDEKHICDLVKVNLEQEGFKVSCVGTGEAGLKKIKATPPDLIILDLFLPNLDGWQVCRRLKKDAETKHIPVLMLTISSDVEKGYSAGANGYLRKPFTLDDLIVEVKNLLPKPL